jgi:hypothetical protein
MIEIKKSYVLELTEQQAKELYWILRDVDLETDNTLNLVHNELKKLFDTGVR